MFELLSHGHRILFVTCSDSRIDPNLITQTEPGEMFIIRNAGNIIPPYGATNGGEGATVEYAVRALGIKDIIVCGHSLWSNEGIATNGQASRRYATCVRMAQAC